MKYHIQSKATGEWLADYKWESERWSLSWSDDKAKAKLLSRDQIQMLKDDLKGCSAFRGEWSDVRAPDGVVSFGRRLVRDGGVIKFAQGKFRHDKLLPFVGQHIFVEADEYWIVSPHAFRTKSGSMDNGNHICDLEAVK
jgi:hypothetical protein